jgi:hypothetical protein
LRRILQSSGIELLLTAIKSRHSIFPLESNSTSESVPIVFGYQQTRLVLAAPSLEIDLGG